MGEINYQHIEWEDLNVVGEEAKKISGIELIGWGIALVVFISIMILSVPFQRMLITEERMIEKYSPTFQWLNRCDGACQRVVRLEALDSTTNCNALLNLYNEERVNYLLDWRIAIDDRATSLGCSGFPKDMSFIEEDTRKTIALLAKRKEDYRDEQRIRLETEKAQKPQRFEQSIVEGKLNHLVRSAYPDPSNPAILGIALLPAWDDLPERVKEQTAQVFWQKWANIYSPTRPEDARIRLIDSSGANIGGSPPGSAQPIRILK